MNLLCIGGPAHGQRYDVPDSRTIKIAPQPSSVHVHTYDVRRFFFTGREVHVLVLDTYSDRDADHALSDLFIDYVTGEAS